MEGADAVGDDGDEHRARLQPGAAGARPTSSGCASWTPSPPPARSSGAPPASTRRRSRPRCSCCRPRTGSRRTARSPTAAAGRSGRTRSCRPRARPATTTGSWPSSSSGCASSTASRAGSTRTPLLELTYAVPGPGQARARRDRPGDQRPGPQHRQAAGDLRRAQGRRHHHRRRLDLHRALPGERQPDQAPRRRPGPGEERPDRHGLLPELGVELAAQPARALQPRLGRPARAARGIRSGRGSAGTPPPASGSATCPTTRPTPTRATPRRRCRSS